MLSHFQIEPAGTPFGAEKSKSIKVFASSVEELPVKIDKDKRFAIFLEKGEGFLDQIHNFEIRKDDIWVITMPRCGTTWMLELVWLLANDLDFETALTVQQKKRCPYFEFCALYPSMTPQSLDVIENLKSPRVIKSHLPMHMLPKGLWSVKPKVIYVARDPKDSAVSYYHFMCDNGSNQSTKEEFLNSVLENEMFYNPFWNHVVEFWELRNESYIYFTSFERMKKDLRTIVWQLSEFLQKKVRNEQIEKLLQHLSFEQMKNNLMCNFNPGTHIKQSNSGAESDRYNFIRKGEVGSHKEDISEDIIKSFDDWTLNELKPFGVTSRDILYS